MNAQENSLIECRALHLLLDMGQLKAFSIVHTDEPDFLTIMNDERVAIEVTNYFQYPKTDWGVPQCLLEDAWGKLRTELMELSPPAWCSLSMLVFLRGRALPKQRQLKQLAKTLVESVKDGLAGDLAEITDFGGDRLASDHVAKIRVVRRPSALCCDWACAQVLVGCVGLGTDYIESSIKGKSTRVPTYRANTHPDKLWLLLYAEGWQLSSLTLLAPDFSAELRDFSATRQSLFASSGFDGIWIVSDFDKCGCQLFPVFRRLSGNLQQIHPCLRVSRHVE